LRSWFTADSNSAQVCSNDSRSFKLDTVNFLYQENFGEFLSPSSTPMLFIVSDYKKAAVHSVNPTSREEFSSSKTIFDLRAVQGKTASRLFRNGGLQAGI